MAFDEIKGLILEQGRAFDAFRDAHGDRITSLEKKLASEAREREDLEARLNRKGFSADGRENNTAAEAEFKALGEFAKSGDDAELKSLSVGTDPDGGYTVLPQMANTIRTKVRDVSPIARLARHVILDRADGYQEPFDRDDMAAQWTGEGGSRPGLDTPNFGLLNVPLDEIYTSQVVTQKLLDTSMLNVGDWVESRISNKFARSEGAAFIAGDGISKPRGLLSYQTASDDDGNRDEGVVQYVASGASGAFGSSPGDKLVDMVHTLRAPYRANAVWLMNRKTAGVVRKIKATDGHYLWTDGLSEGMPDRLMGFPVYLDEEMPDIAANSLSIAFGDMSQAYVIVEQPGIKILRDPFTSKPNVIIYAYRRVGGAMAEDEAVKLMKFAAS